MTSLDFVIEKTRSHLKHKALAMFEICNRRNDNKVIIITGGGITPISVHANQKNKQKKRHCFKTAA